MFFGQIFYLLCIDTIPRILALLERDQIILCTFTFLNFQKTVTHSKHPQRILGQQTFFTKGLCPLLFYMSSPILPILQLLLPIHLKPPRGLLLKPPFLLTMRPPPPPPL